MMKKLPLLAFLAMLTLTATWASADDTPAQAPAAAAAAEPQPTAPVLVAVDKISSGDTAWMLTSTTLVLMMSIPGLALFYGGMVRK
jgi:Amt family ammonium transporter